jgi:DNA invertase Pin-like site-specific DNA recombinase
LPPASGAMIFTSTRVFQALVLHARSSIAPSPTSRRGDKPVITTLDRLGRSTQNMLDFAEGLRDRSAGLRELNLGGGDVDTSSPMRSMLFTNMAALAQTEHDIKRERIIDYVSKRRDAGKDLGGRPQRVTDSQIRSAIYLVESGDPAAQVARDLGMSRATFYRRSRALTD